jgi:hypothetical protein
MEPAVRHFLCWRGGQASVHHHHDMSKRRPARSADGAGLGHCPDSVIWALLQRAAAPVFAAKPDRLIGANVSFGLRHHYARGHVDDPANGQKAAFFSALDLATGRGATVRNGNGLPALNLHKFAALNGFGAVQNNFSAQAGGVCAGSKQRRAGLRGKRHALNLVYGDQCGAHWRVPQREMESMYCAARNASSAS